MNPDLTPIATEHAQLAAFKADAAARGWTPAQAVAVADTATVETLLDATFVAGYHRCACGAMIVASETRCYPCWQGNRARGPIYGASLAGASFRPGGPTPTADITVGWQSSGDQAPVDALRAVEAVWLTPVDACHACAAVADRSEALAARVDDLLDQNDALAAENSALARQVVALRNQGILAPEGWEQRAADLLAQNDALCSQIVALKAHEIELCAQVRQGKAGT
jgi:hypothetical protein